MRPILALILFAATVSLAQVPRTISFQGVVSQPTGSAITSPVTIMFSIYTAASGGSPLWTETHASVTPVNGIVNVMLGSVTPLNLAFDQPYFLGLAVGGGAEMTPRTALVGAPYAMRSVTAETLATPIATGVIVDQSIPLDRLGNSCATGQILVRSPSGWLCLPGP